MTQQIKINKIEIQIGAKKLNLSIEDAKLLQAVLNATFASSTITYIEPLVPQQPLPYYQITCANSTLAVNTKLDGTEGTLCIKRED